MVMVTLSHNADNLKTNFLLDFVNEATQIPKKRLKEEKLTAIQNEIAKRVNETPLTNNEMEKITKVFQRLPQNESLISALRSKLDIKDLAFQTYEYMS